MIKVVNLVALLAAPLVVTLATDQYSGQRPIVLIVMLVLLGAIGLAVMRSKQEDPESQQVVEAVAHTGAD
jgi:F0F1-type ATP synthase assembly protein I